MPEEIKPSGTDWDHAAEQADWEKQAVDTIQTVLWKDFGDGDSIDEEVLDEKTIRTAYMGAGPVEEIVPSPIEKYVPPHGKGVDADTQVTKWRLRYPDLTGIEIARKGEDGTPGDTLLKAEGSGVGQVFRGHLFVRPGFPCDVLLAAAGIWTKGFQAGKRSMDHRTRARLYRELHELLNHAIDNMPDLEGTYSTGEDGEETVSVDLQGEIRERLQDARDELKGDTYHVNLPAFVVEVDEDEEDDAPAPRPETEEMDPEPFSGGAAELLADVFTSSTNRVLMEADGEPAPTYKGEWGKDSTGHPIRVEQLGNPYEGRATFKVQAFGEPDPAAVEASMGWKMLDRMDMDTVWLNLLLLSYASATHRRGERPTIRIGRRSVEKVFGYRNGNYTMKERAQKIRRHVEALQSIFVQFQNVRRHGDKLHFKGDMAGGAPLWNLRMVAEGEKDLFTGKTVADWHLEAREGLWATEFLHNHADQFTTLPKEWFKQIDRRGSRNYAQRLAAYLLFQFRINAKNGARVKRRAATLLEVCGEDMGKPRDTERRSELKRCLSKALNTLDRDYGIEVNAERVLMENTSGMNFDTWKNRTVQFAPPASIEGRIFKAEGGDAPPLPNVAGDWTPKQIRHLRTEVIGDTQEEFGEKLHDVTKQYISQLERGTSDPSTRIRKRLDALHSRYS